MTRKSGGSFRLPSFLLTWRQEAGVSAYVPDISYTPAPRLRFLHSLIFCGILLSLTGRRSRAKSRKTERLPANNGENYGISGKRRDHCERKEYGGKRK